MRYRSMIIAALAAAAYVTAALAHEPPYANGIPGVTVEVLAKSEKSWNGSLLPVYPSEQPQITIIRYQFAPGAVLPVHKHPVINAGGLLRGTLNVRTETGQTLELKAGDPIIELVNQWHEGVNSGSDTAELIIVYAGTPNSPLAVRQVTPEATQPAAATTPIAAPPSALLSGSTVPFISGGVGDESMAAITAQEKAFDLKLFLVGQSGSYLSDVRITITDQHGKGVLLTSSEGPLLLANLPSGNYTVKAQKNGQTLEQKISVTRGKLSTTYFRFPGE